MWYITLLILLVGCGSDVETLAHPDGTENFIHIRSAFPENITPVVYVKKDACPAESLDKATEFWTKLGYPVVWEYVDTFPNMKQGVITLTSTKKIDFRKETVVGYADFMWTYDESCSTSQYGTILVERCSPEVIAHEIGHNLGLGHSPNKESLMYYKNSPLNLPEGERLAILDSRKNMVCQQGDSYAKVSSQRPRYFDRATLE